MMIYDSIRCQNDTVNRIILEKGKAKKIVHIAHIFRLNLYYFRIGAFSKCYSFPKNLLQ